MSWVPSRRFAYSGPGSAVEGWRAPPLPSLPPSPAAPYSGKPSVLPSPATSSASYATAESPACPGLPKQDSQSELGATGATADEEQLQSMLSALRVALGKKEAALVSVAGQLADVQSRLQDCEAERRQLSTQLQDLQLASGAAAPDSLPAAASVTPEGRLLAQVRQDLGKEAARAADLEAERDALLQDVSLLQQQLTAAAQAEAKERERLCMEATQSRLLARARARQVEQLQAELQQTAGSCSSMSAAASQKAEAALAEAASAKAAAADASERLAAAEAAAAQLKQQLGEAQAAARLAENRATQADAELMETRQQMEWQALRVAELEKTSSVGQLIRKYEVEMQQLRAQFDADRRNMQEQLAQAARQQQHHQQQHQPPSSAVTEQASLLSTPMLSPDSAAWAELFDEPIQQGSAAEMHDAAVQTEQGRDQQQQQQLTDRWTDPALLEAARLEIQCLHETNARLLEAQTQAQNALQDALEQQRNAGCAQEQAQASQRAALQEREAALEAARRAQAGLQDRLSMAERQLAHQAGEVQALREANEKLELALAAHKEEQSNAGQLSLQQAERLQDELRRAMAHTDALEAQVQQLRQQAAADAEVHQAAVQQGVVDAAEQVAAALQAAAKRHEQQVLQLQAQLAEACQRYQAAHIELCELQQVQLLRQQSMVDGGVQVSTSVWAVHAGVQTDAACAPNATEAGLSSSYSQAAGLLPPAVVQSASRGSGACELPPVCSSEPQASSVVLTAKQLQLELARVKITPLKPLPGGDGSRPSSSLRRPLSRLGSACGEASPLLGGWQAPPGQLQASFGSRGCSPGSHMCSRLSPNLPGMQQQSCLAAAPPATGSSSSCAGEDHDDWRTPMAGTPVATSAQLSPQGGIASPRVMSGAASTCSWQDSQHEPSPQRAAAEACFGVQLQRALTSLSDTAVGIAAEDTAALPPGSRAHSTHGWNPEDSHSVLGSSTGSSVSQMDGRPWQLQPGSSLGSAGGVDAPPAAWVPQHVESSVGIDNGIQKFHTGGMTGGIPPGGSTWNAASLDASLARLAAFTAGMRRH